MTLLSHDVFTAPDATSTPLHTAPAPQRAPTGRHQAPLARTGVASARDGAPLHPPAVSDLEAAAARSTAALLRSVGYELWMVNRVTDDAFTTLMARGSVDKVPVGTETPYDDTLCGQLLVGPGAVVTDELATSRSPRVREIARDNQVQGYAGALLRAADGSTLGSLCAISTPSVTATRQTAALLEAYAFGLGEVLGRELRDLPDARAADLEAAAANRDETTALPDRRGWGLLLQREEQRARTLGEPSGVVVVDLGPLRTVRAVRRAVDAVREVTSPSFPVARLGGRQLGILCAGATPVVVATTAVHVRDQLRAAAAPGVRVGAASRRGPGDVDAAWRRAEREAVRAGGQLGR